MVSKPSRKSLPYEIDTFSFVIRAIQGYSEVESEKILRMIGVEMGHAISGKLAGSNINQLLQEIGELSKDLKIGEMEVTQEKPIQLTFHRCLGCDQIPGPDQHIHCPFREALLKTIVDDKLNANSAVKFLGSEGSEWGMKDCKFQVDL